MNTPSRSFFAISVAMVATCFLMACSKSGAPAANVDVGAATEQLKSPDATVRTKAATDLAAAGPKSAAAVPALIETLKDPDPLVARLSAYALGQIGPAAKEAIPALKTSMQSGTREMYTASLNAIRAIDNSQAPDVSVPNAPK